MDLIVLIDSKSLYLPDWYDNKETKKGVAAAKEQNSEKTDEDYQQTKIEIMLKQLRGQMA